MRVTGGVKPRTMGRRAIIVVRRGVRRIEGIRVRLIRMVITLSGSKWLRMIGKRRGGGRRD